MDVEGRKFGSGPRELGGAVDLICKYKLWPYYESFCKRSIPLSISGTRYLHNVVGDTEIRKGEGMELDELLPNTSYRRGKNTSVGLFNLYTLGDAFRMKEATSVELSLPEKGIPTLAANVKNELKEKDKKKKKIKSKVEKKIKDDKKHKYRDQSKSCEKDKDRSFCDGSGSAHLKSYKKRRLVDGHGFERLPIRGNQSSIVTGRSGQRDSPGNSRRGGR